MENVMNATASRSAASTSGPVLDNRRVLAGLIDLAVIGAGSAVILAAAGGSLGAPLAGVLVCWALYYYFAFESGNGQTLGKRLMKIRVVRTDGAPAEMREIAIRTVVRVIDMQFIYVVGLIAMLATGERRGRLGDLAADTMIATTADEAAKADPGAGTPAAKASFAGPRIGELHEQLFAEASVPETPAVPELRPFEPVAELDPADVEFGPAEVGLRPAALALGPELEDPQDADEERPEDLGDEADPDLASETIKELAADVAAAKEAEDEPVAEDEAPGEEEDEADVTVTPVETVSAIDLVMDGENEVSEEALADLMGDESPADARRE
jgi:uncharacterized RDD family membrane protein YckC